MRIRTLDHDRLKAYRQALIDRERQETFERELIEQHVAEGMLVDAYRGRIR